MSHFEESKIIPASPTVVFEFANDHRNFFSHMNKSSWMMAGSSMETEIDEDKGQKVGSHIKMKGKALGINLYLDEVVTEYSPPIKKVWQTQGDLNLLVIGHYTMGFEITPVSDGSNLKVFIDYDLPKSPGLHFLGLIIGDYYAKWCVTQMLEGVSENFWKKSDISQNKAEIFVNGLIASSLLLSVYFITVSLISGWTQFLFLFSSYWYFVLSLSLLFGIQVSLYTYLRQIIKKSSSRTLAVSGTTSTAAMISCCAHHLAEIAPVLGTVGIISVISQYQIEIFWLGLFSSLLSLLYIIFQISKVGKKI